MLKEDCQKPLKKVTSFLLSNPALVTKQVQKNPFINHALSDQVWWYNIKRFLSHSKNYICKFMQANLWHHKLFHFPLPFWIWKVWKGREKNYKNLNISRTKRVFKMKQKTFFIVFEGLSVDEKIKIWQKIVDTSFKKP